MLGYSPNNECKHVFHYYCCWLFFEPSTASDDIDIFAAPLYPWTRQLLTSRPTFFRIHKISSSIRLPCPNSKNASLILLSSSANLIRNDNCSTSWDSTSSARIEENLAQFISFMRFACSKSFPRMLVISFWMRVDKYKAFFLEGFSVCHRKGSFVSANCLRLAKNCQGFDCCYYLPCAL